MIKECPKSPTGHHCDHEQGEVHYSQPKNMMCCYCGRFRIEQPISTSGGTFTPAQHGPYVKPPQVMY